MYHSYAEIFEQGESLGRTYQAVLARQEEIRAFFADASYDEIVFVACGSSYWASLSSAMTMQRETGIRCSAVKSGDVVLSPGYYQKAYGRPLLIAPSRSGATTETLRAIEILRKAYNCRVFSLTIYPDSPVARISQMNIHIPWVNEVSVCQTRSFSSLYLAEVMLAAIVARNEDLLEQLHRYICEFEELSKAADERIRSMLEGFEGFEKFVALGNGVQYGVVIEGAYITVEMAQQVAAYYGLLEFRHGPIVTADERMLVCITHSGEPSYADKMAQETRAKGARVAMVCDVDRYKNKDYCFSIGHEACDEVVALYAVFVMQGIACHRAVKLGVDPDQPGDLVSWIAI